MGNGVNMIRFLTSGESHGEKLTGIIEGLPFGYEEKLIEIVRVKPVCFPNAELFEIGNPAAHVRLGKRQARDIFHVNLRFRIHSAVWIIIIQMMNRHKITDQYS